MDSPKRYRILTLGCRTNQYESQAYATQLEALGFEVAKEGEPASLCIVNTCTVTETANRDSARTIRRLARDNPGARIAVTGCALDHGPHFADGLGVSVEAVPNQKKEELIRHLFPELDDLPEFSIRRFEGHTRAFVKVQDGCNSFCSYCIIPYVRGRSRSRSTEEILTEVHELVANGYKEVVLTGINIGDFEHNLADLVRAVDRIEGIERIRISSIDPDEVDDDLADAVLNGVHTCPSMHIVLQAGSNMVLKRMNRKYTRQVFMETVERLRTANSDFTFTTDVIVGFPGETEVDFEETLAVMRDVQFAKVHMFPYSRRPRTRAAQFSDEISSEIIRSRKSKVLRVAEQEAYALRDQYVGRQMTVLTEANKAQRGISGHTANFLPVHMPVAAFEPNQLVTVSITSNEPNGLCAHAYHDQSAA